MNREVKFEKLLANEVHLWSMNAGEFLQEITDHSDCLSKSEMTKSTQFNFEIDRQNYIARHVFLKKILAKYLSVSCSQIILKENEYGKPYLYEPDIQPALQFNMSKSCDHVLVALTHNEYLGCDIEKHNNKFDCQFIIENNFSDKEKTFLHDIRFIQKNFFDYWVTKESYLKALGKGLSVPLNSFTLKLDGKDNVAILETLPELVYTRQWSVKRIHICDNYSAAICYSGNINKIKYLRHSESVKGLF